MTYPDIVPELQELMPELRGRLSANASLAEVTWFRVGGPAQVLYRPADESDLCYFLGKLPADVPVQVIGLGSNLLIRDGGLPGVVIRMGRGFAEAHAEDDYQVRAGPAVPDVKVARTAAEAGIDGLAFYRGIPGAIGGALRMNAGAHGTETKDVLLQARAVDRSGQLHILSNADMGYSYRHCSVSEDWIFTEALYQGRPGDPAAIQKEMDEVAAYREEHQPTREKTGGSTFKNPPDHSAWKLIDAAGCRGLQIGGAMVSEKHCNFLINQDNASGEDLEKLGETVRARVKEDSGIELQWEIKRLGLALPGHATGTDLAEA